MLSHLVFKHAFASLLASFSKITVHNFKLVKWNDIYDYNVKQCICMPFHGRSTGTVSVSPCPPSSLFKWRSCSFCTRPYPSAVLNLKGTDLERWSWAREIISKLVTANKYYLKSNLLIDILPQNIQVSCLFASTGRPMVTYHFWLVETTS